MGEGMGSLVEGLAGGIQQGQKNAMMRELQDMQMQHLKTTSKAAEIALKMEQAKGNIFDTLTPDEQKKALFPKTITPADNLKEIMAMLGVGGTQQVPLPEYQPGQGMPPFAPGATMTVPQTIAQGQIGGLDSLGMDPSDLIRGVLKKEIGAEAPKYNRTAQVIMPDGNPGTAPMNDRGVIDVSKAVPAPFKLDMQAGVGPGMAPIQTPVNPYTRQPMGPSLQTGAPPMMQVETPTAGGGKVRRVVPLFGGGGSKVTGTTAGGIRTELDLLDVPISSADITKWSDGKGNTPPTGWTPRQAQARGFKQTQEGMGAEAGGKAVMLNQAIGDIEMAEKLLFPAGGGFNRQIAFGAGANLPEWMVKNAQVAQSSIENAIAAKLRLETGAQANAEEIKHISKRFFPSAVRDDEKSARYKISRLKQFMREGKFAMDPKGRIVVVEPPEKKPSLKTGGKKDPSVMTNDELLKALR